MASPVAAPARAGRPRVPPQWPPPQPGDRSPAPASHRSGVAHDRRRSSNVCGRAKAAVAKGTRHRPPHIWTHRRRGTHRRRVCAYAGASCPCMHIRFTPPVRLQFDSHLDERKKIWMRAHALPLSLSRPTSSIAIPCDLSGRLLIVARASN